MRKIVLNLAVSLDGYIARKNNSVDWLDDLDTGGSDLGFSAFLERIDTIIMGRKSYETTLKLGNGTWPFLDKKTIVFTKQALESTTNIQFINENPKEVLNTIKQLNGKDIWLFGGGSFIATCKELNLIDEYIITTIPIFIGNGVRLFNEVERETELELLSIENVNGIVQAIYRVKKRL